MAHAGSVKVTCTLTGQEHLVALDGAGTVGALLDAVHQAVGAQAGTRDVVYVDASGGEVVLNGDGGLGEVGIRGVEEVIEARLSAQEAARGELAALGIGKADAMEQLVRALTDHGDGGAAREARLALARTLALSGWAGAEGAALHLLAMADERAVPGAAAGELVAVLVAGGANVDAVGPYTCPRGRVCQGTPLRIAVERDNRPVLRALLAHGCSVGIDALDVASQHGHCEALRLLLEVWGDTPWPTHGVSPVFIAAAYGRTDALRLLIEAKADVGCLTSAQESPCIIAAREGHAAALRMLIDAGADPARADQLGTTACYCAASRGHADALLVLIEAGVDVNATTREGETPCFIAAQCGHAAALQLLIEAGADVNAATHTGTTPCYIAARGGQVHTLRLLLAAGADPLQESGGQTPISIARDFGHRAVVELLLPPSGTHCVVTPAEGDSIFMRRPGVAYVPP